MIPTIGRIVIYNTTDEDRKTFSRFRENGTVCNSRPKLPAIIVGINGSTVDDTTINLRLFTDGNYNCDLWIASVKQGDDEGQWNWPARV